MKNTAKWIWYRGEYETYHHKLLSYRRQERGCDYACAWYVPNTEISVRFFKEFEAPEDTVIRVVSRSKGMVRVSGTEKMPVNSDIPVKKGKHSICVELFDLTDFCAIYVDSEYVVSDESWTADLHDGKSFPVDCEPFYGSADDDPRVFPFRYEKVNPVSRKEMNGGVLFDFGKELFGVIEFENIPDNTLLVYGESREEALDPELATVRETLTSGDEKRRPARAFRYIFISAPGEIPAFTAEYEFLPLEDKASFRCGRELVNKIWDVCAYTFHLNSREFYLDGIKRDRWVWSGDAYQSYMINNYLYFDKGMTKRTITALLGKPPYRTHVNTINDYSAYLIIAVNEYYEATGDKAFVEKVYDKVKALYSFIVSRLDENGYVTGLPGDWIFIDWGDVEKSGAVCAEQILLYKVYTSMDALSQLMGEAGDYSAKSELLKKNILADYWSNEKKAFIDSPFSGKYHVSRQSNIFALLYDLVDEDTAKTIYENVLDNDEITPITTPYFKLYELLALCRLGYIEKTQDYIEDYWGGMLALGATSVWEQYDPERSGTEHYGMYGSAYDKSLCHAWGSGPILLLGKYVCGVEPTGIGYKTFRVEPKPGKYESFTADVPVNGGTVHIEYSENKVTVSADVGGGTLIFNGKSVSIPENIPVTL